MKYKRYIIRGMIILALFCLILGIIELFYLKDNSSTLKLFVGVILLSLGTGFMKSVRENVNNQNVKMERMTVVINSKIILAKDYSGRLYRVVKSDVKLHKNQDNYFCFVQRKKGLFWRCIEVITYEDYLLR